MPATPESAVQLCVKAHDEAYDREDPKDTGLTEKGWKNIRAAYRHAMPFLLPDPDAIDAFIACVTHGLILQVFTESEASKLLYAAQVAIGARRARTEAAKAQAKLQTHANPTSFTNSVTLPLCNFATKNTPTPSPSLPAGKVPAPQAPRKLHATVAEIDDIIRKLNGGRIPEPGERVKSTPYIPEKKVAAPQVPVSNSAPEPAPSAVEGPLCPAAPKNTPTPLPPERKLAAPQVPPTPSPAAGEAQHLGSAS